MLNFSSTYNFLVYGNPAYSRSLADSSTITKYFDITGGVDHYLDCPNDDFRLNSAIFNYANDKNTICQLGYELVSVFNSIHKVFSFTNFRRLPLRVEEFYFEDSIANLERKDTRFSINDFSHGKFDLVEDVKSEILRIRDPSIFHFLLISLISEDVYLILKLIDRIDLNSDDWSQLYKIFETIENLEKETNIDIKIDTGLKRKFKNSANNFSITGVDSRHGYTNNKGGKETLSYDKALAFILDISQKYLKTLLLRIKSENEVNPFRLPLSNHRRS